MQCSCLSIVPLGHIEDDRVSVKLGRGIAVYGPRGVMLEGSSDELPRCLRSMNISDARLGIPFQFLQRNANAFTMRFAHAIIAAYKSGERDGLRCRERGIPSCSML